MNKIVEVAQDRKRIMASQEIYCPKCNVKQFSPFDKLYASTYGICVDCDMPGNIDKNSENIFKLIEA